MTDARPAAVIVLAAGAGTRMKSATPKVLHRIAGRSLLHHALAAATGTGADRVSVVVRHERDLVAAEAVTVDPDVLIADQDAIPGTGRAVWCGLNALDEGANIVEGAILVTSGDVPRIDQRTLVDLAAAHIAHDSAATILSAIVPDPTGYGRIVRDADSGDVVAIVEEADATPDQRAINEINTGIYAFDAVTLRDSLAKLDQDNTASEMYLTDVISLAREAGGSVRAITTDDPSSAEGVNDRAQLAQAAAAKNREIVDAWMRAGVGIVDPATTWIDADVDLAEDVTILPGTQLLGATTVATGATIGPDTTLVDVTVGEGASVVRTHGSDSEIGAGAAVGPFTYLRPGTVLSAKSKAGAFVEMKKATIGEGAKVPHLSYVGDADVGDGSNIGAATIFVNYDGVSKSRTTIGKHVKIGSDNTLVAPVNVGDGAYTGAGSIIRHDVPPGALGLNSSPQHNVDGWVLERRPGTASAEAAKEAGASGPGSEAINSLSHDDTVGNDAKGGDES